MKARSLLVGVAAILLVSNLDSSVLAEPMLSPALEEASQKSEWIVIAEFVSYNRWGNIYYKSGE